MVPYGVESLNSLRPSDSYTCICGSKLATIGSDNSLSPGHYLNQCWNIVNWSLGNKLQWNLNWNLHIFIHENAFENVVRKLAAILFRPQWVKLKLIQVIVCHLLDTRPLPKPVLKYFVLTHGNRPQLNFDNKNKGFYLRKRNWICQMVAMLFRPL